MIPKRLGKPPAGAQIDWRLPITRNLIFCAPCAEGAGCVFDIVKRDLKTTTTRPTWAGARSGLSARDWEFAQADTAHLNWTTGPFTFAAFFRIVATPANGEYPSIFGNENYVGESNNQGWNLYLTAPNDGTGARYASFVGRNNGAAFYKLVSPGNYAIGEHMLVHTSNGTTRRLYLDGLEVANTTNNATPVTQVTRGVYNVSTASGKNPTYICYAWNRELLPSEVLQLWESPYLGLRASPEKYYFIGANITLAQTIEPGGIASEEAFGTPAVMGPVQTVSPGGIASLEAFGSPTLGISISPSGIASLEAFGTPQVGVSDEIHPQSIESEEAFGAGATVYTAGGVGVAIRTFDLFINGSSVYRYLVPETFNRTTGLGSSRGTAQFTLKTHPGFYRPQWGQPVVFVRNGEREFGGIISRVKERWPTGTSAMFIDVECQDWSSIFNRRVCIGKYTAASLQSPAQAGDGVATLQEILESIVANCLDGEGFTLGTVDTSVVMAVGDEFDFRGTVAEAFNKLGEYFQVDWWADWYKTISFSAYASNPAPFGLTESTRDLICSANSVVLTRGAGSYRNVQYVRSATSPIGVVKSVSRWGDGTTRAFDATEIMTKVPRVFVTALGPGATTEKYVVRKSSLTGGPVNPPAGYDPDWWFWHDNEVDKYRVQQWFLFTPPQGNGNPFPAQSDEIVIQWESSNVNQAFASDAAGIAARQAIEGGSGKWEAIEDHVAAAGGTAADTLSEGLTIRNDEEIALEFETSRDGLRPGQLMSVSLLNPLITADMLIESISSQERNMSLSLSPGWWVHQVRLVADTVGKQRRDSLRKWIEDVNAKLRTPPLTQQQILNFWFPIGTLAAGVDVTNHISPRRAGIAAHLVIIAKTPLDDDLVFDINRGGVSICGSTKPTLLAGETIAVYNDWAVNPLKLVVDDIMSCDVDSVGTADVAGEDLIIELAMSG